MVVWRKDFGYLFGAAVMQDQIDIAHAAASASVASKASYITSLGTALGSAAAAQWVGVVVGIVLGCATFWATWYWRRREFEARRAHERRELELQEAERFIRSADRAE